jgi:hypothetical protein
VGISAAQMDFIQILANGLLMVKSFASSFNMDVNIAFPRITLSLQVGRRMMILVMMMMMMMMVVVMMFENGAQ